MSKVKYKSSYHKWRLENGFSVISNNKLELFFLDEISTDIYSIIKYSLQGTTQGNGLTGADMPVRFSM